MLPLDQLPKSAYEAFAKHGASFTEESFALNLDLLNMGRRGAVFLAFDSARQTICRYAEATNEYAEFELAKIKSLYVDNFITANRLLAVTEDGGKKETVIIAYCTNTVKRKLFVFCEICDRIKNRLPITSDDPIFEQFFAKCPKCGAPYSDPQRKICEHCSQKGRVMKRMLAYFKPYRLQLITVLLCMFATSGLSLLNPVINGMLLYDNVISEDGRWHVRNAVFVVVGVILLMAVVTLAVNIIQNRANAKMSNRVTRDMKIDVFNALSALSVSYFNQNPTGRLMSRVNYDADRVKNFYISGVPNLIVNGINFIGLTIFLFWLNPSMTLIVFIPVPIIVCIFKFALPPLKRLYTKQWRASTAMNASLGDSLNGERVIKAFSKETEETARFNVFSDKAYKTSLQVNLASLTIFPVVSMLIGLSSQAIWGYGGLSVMNNHMTYGEFTTYIQYISMVFGPLNFFTNFANMLTDTIDAARRMFEVIDADSDVVESKDAVELDTIKDSIEFKHVSFSYTPSRQILSDVSFKIKAGQHVGLVGHTGSGKSTIANLITRMYDTVGGSIYIDGINIRDITIRSLRKNVAIVSQEVFIFYGTIADNIRYARPDATMDEVIAAARCANAHDFIMRLPSGYETVVGSGSRSLSGGERQRISIARALLLSPSLLILDEATAAMDTETEALISEALAKLVQGKTTISIAHRLSTLRDCDYLYAIENGEIAEKGTHEELLQKKGVYYKLYTLQNEAMKKVASGK